MSSDKGGRTSARARDLPAQIRLPAAIIDGLRGLQAQEDAAVNPIREKKLLILESYFIGLGYGKFDPGAWMVDDSGVLIRQHPPTPSPIKAVPDATPTPIRRAKKVG